MASNTTAVVSTFASDAEGWTIQGDVQSDNWQASGGNPGGFFAWVDAATGSVCYFDAGSQFLGNDSAFYGGTLSYDIEDTTGTYFNDDDVELTGDGMTIVATLGQAGTTWTHYSIKLDDTAGFTVGSSSGAAATAAQIQDVLANLTQVLIRAEYISGAENGGLDNVILAAPAAANGKFWQDTSDTWTAAADWSGGTAPVSTDNVYVEQGDPQVTAPITVASITDTAEIDFQSAGASTVSQTVNNTGILDLDTVAGSGGSSLAIGGVLTNGATLQIGNTSLSAPASISAAGFMNASGATVQFAGGASNQSSLTVTGGTSSLSGTISGTGLLSLAGGTTTISSGVSLAVSKLAISGSGTQVTLNQSLNYSGSFSEGAGSTLTLNGHYLGLNGPSTFSGGTVNGNSALYNHGTATVSGLTIGGSVLFQNSATLNQAGGTVTVGVGTIAAYLFNDANGTYSITDNSGIARGTSTGSSFTNAGQFKKTGGTNTSTVAASLTDTGTITASSGMLAFSGPTNSVAGGLAGTGTIAFTGGATTLKSGASATVSNLAVSGSGTSLTLATNLSYANSFTEGAASTVSIGSGDTLTLTGTSSIGGTVSGAGTLALGGGTATIAGGASVSVSNLALSGGGTAVTLNQTLNYNGSFSEGAGSKLTLNGHYLGLNGPSTFSGGTVSGNSALYNHGTATVSGLTIGGSVLFQNSATVNQSGGTVTVGDGTTSSAFLFNASSGTYSISDNSGIGRGNATGSSFTNAGLLQKTSGTGFSEISVNVVDTGTISVASGDLRFDGTTNSFTGSFVGPGMIDYGAGGTATLANVAMTGGACSTNFGTVKQTGTVTLSDGSTITNQSGSSWSFAGDVGLALAAGSTSPQFTNSGSLTKTSGTGTSLVAIDVTGAGTVTAQTGTLTFDGAVNSFSGAISGAGTVLFGGGATTLASGATVSVSHLSLAGAGTSLTLNQNLTYSGSFSEGAGSTLTLGGAYLGLNGPSTFSGGTVNGTSALYNHGIATVSGLIVGGSALFQNSATLNQSGGSVTVGDGTSSSAFLFNASGATYSISDNSGIARGMSTGSSITNAGLLQKTGGTGTSLIAPAISNTGTITVQTGVLDLAGALKGTGNLLVQNTAILELGSTVATGSAVDLQGSGTTLQLDDAQDFKGTVKDFAGMDTLDLRSINFGSGTGPSVSYNDTSSGSNHSGTLTVSDGTHTANIAMIGSYTMNNFVKNTDSGTGTAITFHT